MLYDLKADAFKVLNHASQVNSSRELARQRLAKEALAGRQKRTTDPSPGLLDRVRKLAKQEPGITPEPAS